MSDHQIVYNVALVNAFITLQLFGVIVFTLMVLSACIFRSVKRQPIWFSFCISWIVYGISYSLLFFAGQQHREHPQRNICVAQAALIYGAPLITTLTSSFLVVHLLLSVISALSRSSKYGHRSYPIVTAFLIWFPWLVWVFTVVTTLVIGIKHLDHVQLTSQGTFCRIADTLIQTVIAITVIIMAVAVLCMEVAIGRILYFNRAIKEILGQSVTMSIRIFIFTLIVFSAVLGGILTTTAGNDVPFEAILSILPPAAAIIFGTQADLMKAWMFWTWNRQTPTTLGSVTLTTITD